MMKIKVLLTLSIDTEEYPVPSDGDVASEINDALREYLHDLDGAEIVTLKTIMEK
jgi:hypothetical protein